MLIPAGIIRKNDNLPYIGTVVDRYTHPNSQVTLFGTRNTVTYEPDRTLFVTYRSPGPKSKR